MLRPASFFVRSVSVILTVFGILWLPRDALDYQQAAQPWREALAMVDQNTALWAFVAVLVGIIVWSDGRRFLADRRAKQASSQLKAFVEARTRFTIREAACIAVGVHPSQFDKSPAAQSEANEMLYYAREGLVRPANMTNEQWEAMKRRQEVGGYTRASVTLESHITKEELDTYLRPGWKTWLPVLDNQRTERG